jgi:uncharacterized protein (DUF1697 family)
VDAVEDPLLIVPAFGRSQMYIYFPNGVGRARFPATAIERAVKVSGTARNWNTVTKLLEIAEGLTSRVR